MPLCSGCWWRTGGPLEEEEEAKLQLISDRSVTLTSNMIVINTSERVLLFNSSVISMTNAGTGSN